MGFMFEEDRIFLNRSISACLLSKTGWKKHFAKMDASGNTLDLWICSQKLALVSYTFTIILYIIFCLYMNDRINLISICCLRTQIAGDKTLFLVTKGIILLQHSSSLATSHQFASHPGTQSSAICWAEMWSATCCFIQERLVFISTTGSNQRFCSGNTEETAALRNQHSFQASNRKCSLQG